MKRAAILGATAALMLATAPGAILAQSGRDDAGHGMKRPAEGQYMPGRGDNPMGPGGFGRPDFSELDADGDGQLTADELRAPMRERFDTADTDGDGEITQEEITARAVERAEERAARMGARMMERLDRDGNGSISFDEMRMGDQRDMAERMIDRLDRDDDGTVSEEEMARRHDRRGRHDRGRSWGWHGKGHGDREGWHHHGWGHRQDEDGGPMMSPPEEAPEATPDAPETE